MDTLLRLLLQEPRPDWTWTLDTARVEWTRGNALAMANSALLAYSDAAAVKRQLLARGFSSVIWCEPKVPPGDSQAYVAVRPEAVVVAFRGTEPTRREDWATDLAAAQETFEKLLGVPGLGRVHSGFATSLSSVLPDVLRALAEHDDEKRTLWITGHSLGAALAMLAAAFVSTLPTHPIAGVYTFGQPRVGDGGFAAAYGARLGGRTFRCVNDRDLVPHVPPKVLSGLERLLVSGTPKRLADLGAALQEVQREDRYEHVGQLRLLLPGGGLTSDPAQEAEREPAFLAQIPSLQTLAVELPRLLLRFPWLLKDHAPINPLTHDGYVDRLEALS